MTCSAKVTVTCYFITYIIKLVWQPSREPYKVVNNWKTHVHHVLWWYKLVHSRNTAWGRAWADYYCDTTSFTNFCIRCEPSVPVIPLHCAARHPISNTGTAVSSMSCLCWLWTSQNSSTVSHFTQTQWSVSHMRDGKLPGQHSSTVSVGSICLYHVSAITYLPSSTIFMAD